MDTTPKQDQEMRMVEKAKQGLLEHFDTVQIFVTRHDPAEAGGTVVISDGNGDWYSRYGAVRTWMIKQEESLRQEVRRED